MYKGQTTLMLIVIVIMLFMVLGVFMLSSSISKYSNDEYNNLYVHNLLLSILRKETDYGGSCRTILDALICTLTTNGKCGTKTCREVSDEVVPVLINSILKENFDYMLSVEPESYEVFGGERLVYGNPSLEYTSPRWTSNEKILRYEENMNIKMIITEK